MHAQGNLVVFLSDHGDNFGEQGWVYHFSNVTDAGNRVPVYWVDPASDGERLVDTPVSTRDIFHALVAELGRGTAAVDLLRAPEQSYVVMQSCWYNNQGKTLEKFKFNQICMLEGGTRWMRRRDEWFSAPPTEDGVEAPFVRLPPGVNPIEEAVVAGSCLELRCQHLATLVPVEASEARVDVVSGVASVAQVLVETAAFLKPDRWVARVR
jgi:arylsulfatase A-like enzyme